MIGGISSADFSLWTCAWQSTLLVAIGLFSSFLLRCRCSRAHQVLFLSMIAAVTVPLMSVLVKHYGFGLFAAEPPIAESPGEYEALEGSLRTTDAGNAEELQREPDRSEKNLASAMSDSQGFVFAWQVVLLCAWLAASLILLTRLAVTFALGVRLLSRAKPLNCDQIVRALQLAKTRLGIGKDIEVHTSRRIHSPVIWCWRRRPVLLVSSTAGGLANSIDWPAVLSHELAHWKRRDHLYGLLAELIVCILPWHPLLWWAKSRLTALSEQACDDWVVATSQSSTDYAESLLNLAPEGQMAFVPAVVSTRNGLSTRVRRILKDHCGDPRTGAAWALGAGLLAVCLSVGVALAQAKPAKLETVRTQNQNEPAESLHQAAADGDLEQVKRLLAQGADVNAKDHSGCTPLHFVAKWVPPTQVRFLNYYNPEVMARLQKEAGILKMAELLIARGADVNARDQKGNTPLHYASEYEKKSVAELLVAKGADVHARNQDGLTPLAVLGQGRSGVGKLLVEHGAEIPTIHIAAFLGDLAKVKEFLGQEVPIDAKAKDMTPLAYAAQAGHNDVVQFLIEKGANVKAEILNVAGSGEIAELLIASGADVNPRTGTSPLHTAAARCTPEVLKVLLAHGANIEVAPGNKQTPLSIAMTWHRIDNILFLIANGADVNARDAWRQTPLHYAARDGWGEVVQALVARGAVVDARADAGRTPLDYAATFGRAEVAELLLSKGADPRAKDKFEKTPADRAFEDNHKAVVAVLASKGGVDIPELHLASYLGDLDKVKRFIVEGKSIEERDKYGKTPLAYAAKGSNLGVVRVLLGEGANVSAADGKRMTPLHEAAGCGDKAIAELLIAREADVNADSERGSPLHVAVGAVGPLMSDEDSKTMLNTLAREKAIMDLLLAKGAQINAPNAAVGTPLHLAVENIQKELVQRLIAKGADVNAKGGERTKGGPPLHATIFTPHGADVAEPLILKGADVNAKNKEGATLLHLCAQRAYRRPHARLVLAHGANIDARDNHNATALHYAVESGRADMAQFLVENGADLNATNSEGKTPLCMAKEKDRTAIAELLQKHGAKE